MGLSCSKKKAKKDNQMKRQNLEKDKKGKQNQEKHEIEKESEEVMKSVQDQDEVNQINKEQQIETLKIILNENLPSPKKIDESQIMSFGYQKVILGYLNAYFNHCPIRLSPNVIWQLILNQFAKYVDDNAESLREKFVNFEGKKDLICVRIGRIEDVYKYEDDLIEEFCNKISENVGKELIDNLTPNFSTSTKQTIISGKVSIMSTFKKYFRYGIGMLNCGIPYIVLEGNLDDWEKILEKLKFLKKYNFSRESIEEDLIEIINTKKGIINLDFWRKIIMETRETTTKMIGCMDKEVEEDFIYGWILHFYGWDRIEKNNINKLLKEVVEAPITVMDLETKETTKGILYAGIRDLNQDPNTFEVEPIINYCLSINDHFQDCIVEPLDFDF